MLKEIEKEIKEFWEKNQINRKIMEIGEKKFFLLDGPPYANAEPHVGHLRTIFSKDIWIRHKKMSGYSAYTFPGFDCHGLPIEVKVEEKLGIKNKKEIEEKVGVDKFIEECKKFAISNINAWFETFKEGGIVKECFKPYLTMDSSYIEKAWEIFKKIWNNGLVYKDKKPTFWCPRCETSLAGYEVTDAYTNLKDFSIYVKFPVKGKENEYILVWTTTPWTLVSNVAIAVHPDETYVKVKINNEILILAKERVKPVIEETVGIKEYEIIEELKGKELDGLEYLPLFNLPIQQKLEKRKVIMSIPLLKAKSYSKKVEKEAEEIFEHLVNVKEGSGCVHIAPGHGPEDYEIGLHYKLPVLSPVDESGKFTEEAGKYKGINVREASKIIIEDLKNSGLLFYSHTIIHKYPLCWRCKTPLIFRVSEQWFISVQKIKNKMIEFADEIKWMPEFAREMFKNWVANAIDWCISRQRYWGIPIPIWVCKNGHYKVIGSKEELEKLSNQKINDLHRNVVDKITFKCEKCGEEMKRIKEIFDVWFDSGVSPFASFCYDYNKHLFEKMYPADMINEGLDQIRGWFYSLLVVSVASLGTPSYKAVSMLGWVVDEKGEKMSKSKGNVVFAREALKNFSADALRINYCYGVPFWETQNFIPSQIKEIERYLNIYLNILKFVKEYQPEGFVFKIEKQKLTTIEKWIISKINSLQKRVLEWYENYEFHRIGRSLIDFIVNDLSRFYIKAIRKRMDERSQVIISTILYCLKKATKLLAPIAPFITEKVYQEIKGYFNENFESVHLSQYDKIDEDLIDESLEKEKEIVEEIIETILSLRSEEKIRIRWPLRDVKIYSEEKNVEEIIEKWEEVIKDYTNVKNVELTKEIPKDYKKGSFSLGYVFLNTKLDEELKKEAFINELTRKIQELRKKEGLRKKEKIVLYLVCDEKAKEIVKEFEERIMKVTNSEKIEYAEKEIKGELKFDEKEVKIGFKKL